MTPDPVSVRDPVAVRPAGASRRARRRFGCVAVVMLVVMTLITAVGVGRGLWVNEPAHWIRNRRFLDQTPKAQLAELSEQAFNRILSELSGSSGYLPVDPGEGPTGNAEALGVRTIRLGFDEANAWLNERLDDWLENRQRRLPAGLSDPMLASDSGRLIVAFRYKTGEIDQVFSVLMSLKFLDDGMAVLSIDGVTGGCLPLPTGSVIKRLPGAAGSEDANRSKAIAVLLGQQPFDPVLPIDGSRRARIIGLKVDDQGVGLVVQAEPNGPTH
jgi:hypothetical protein